MFLTHNTRFLLSFINTFIMKIKEILYRNFNTLSDVEKQFYDDNREKFELNLCDKYNTICYSNELIWDVEHLGYTAICEEAYNELTQN